MNSRAPISGFDRPSRASRAIWASWAVSSSRVSTVRLRAVSPVASSSRRGPLGERLAAHRGEHVVRGAQLLARVEPPALAAQPLAVEQVGARELARGRGCGRAARSPRGRAPRRPRRRSAARASGPRRPSAQSVPLARVAPRAARARRRRRSVLPLRAAASTSSTSAQSATQPCAGGRWPLRPPAQRVRVAAEAVVEHRARPVLDGSSPAPRRGRPRPRSVRAISAAGLGLAARARRPASAPRTARAGSRSPR